MRMHAVMHESVNVVLHREQLLLGLMRRACHVVMQIAITQMPKDNILDPWEFDLQRNTSYDWAMSVLQIWQLYWV